MVQGSETAATKTNRRRSTTSKTSSRQQRSAADRESKRSDGKEGNVKRHPIYLGISENTFEFSAQMARQRDVDRPEQDIRAHRNGLIAEAIRGRAENGFFGTVPVDQVDEEAISLYLSFAAYLKSRGKLPQLFESEAPPNNYGPPPVYKPAEPYTAGQINPSGFNLDKEAEAALEGGPDII